MNVNNVIRTITIRGSSEGIDKLTGDLQKLAGAQQNVAVVSEQSAKRVLSLEDAWKKQSMRLDESARSQANIARETKIADGALREGLITQQQHAERLNLISQRYAVATVQAGKFANQTGLNRYEILNLSRQLQDVGVSLAGGQSPFVVLTQQGSQILDVFQASTGSVRGFFSQAIGWAGRFVSSTAGVVTGIGAIAAGALYAASSWSSGQREIDKALIGIGQRSGATAESINKIAEASAGSSKLSISESRTAALEFVKTGNIYTENIGALVGLVKGHAVAIGESSEEASKQLAKIFGGDIAEGADKLNSIYGTISGATRQYAVELDILGKRQEAIALLARQVAPAIQRASEVTGFWARSWDFVSNTSSNAFDKIGKGLSNLTGVGLSREDRLANAQSALRIGESGLGEQRDIAAKIGPDLVPGLKQAEEAVVKLREEVARLNKEIAGAGAETDQSRLLKIGQDADAAVRALVPFIEQLEKVAKAQELIRKAQGTPGAQQGLAGSNTEAARAAEVLAMNIKNTREETDRANASGLALAQKYNTGSIEVAKMAESLSRQLGVAQAVGNIAQIEVQHRARIAELSERLSEADARRIADGERAISLAQIEAQHKQTMVALQGQLSVAQESTGIGQINAQYQATVDLLRLQVGEAKAIEQAEAQRAVSLAQVNAQADQILRNLQQEGELIRASSDAERDRIAARHTYEDLKAKGVDGTKAEMVAMQQLANAEAKRSRAEQEAHDQAMRNIRTRTDAWEAHKQGVISWSEANYEAGKIRLQQEQASEDAAWRTVKALEAANNELREWAKYVPFSLRYAGESSRGYTTQTWEDKGGYLTQFNPEGYSSGSSVGRLGEAAASAAGEIKGLSTSIPKLGDAMESLEERAINSFRKFSSIGGFGGQTIDMSDPKTAALSAHIAALEQQQQTLGVDNSIAISMYKAQIDAIKANTDATNANTDVLSPYYSSDPRQTHLGFRAFAGGGIMTPRGELPLKKYDGGGIANSPQVAVFGEGRTPEAYVPVPSGRIPVEMRQPANSNEKQQRPVNVNIYVQGNADASTVDALRQTAFQQAQAMRRTLGG